MVSISIHDVRSVTLGREDKATPNSQAYSRELVIVTADGTRHEITLFANESGALAVRHSDRFVNVGFDA